MSSWARFWSSWANYWPIWANSGQYFPNFYRISSDWSQLGPHFGPNRSTFVGKLWPNSAKMWPITANIGRCLDPQATSPTAFGLWTTLELAGIVGGHFSGRVSSNFSGSSISLLFLSAIVHADRHHVVVVARSPPAAPESPRLVCRPLVAPCRLPRSCALVAGVVSVGSPHCERSARLGDSDSTSLRLKVASRPSVGVCVCVTKQVGLSARRWSCTRPPPSAVHGPCRFELAPELLSLVWQHIRPTGSKRGGLAPE